MKKFCWLLIVCFAVSIGTMFADEPCEIICDGMGPGEGMPARMAAGNKDIKREAKIEKKEGMGEERLVMLEMCVRIKEQLGLTEDQVKAIENIIIENRKNQVKREAEIQIAKIELMEIMKKENPDFNALRAKTKQISDLQLESKIAVINAMEKGYNVLKPEQKKKLSELKENRKGLKRKEKEEMKKDEKPVEKPK